MPNAHKSPCTPKQPRPSHTSHALTTQHPTSPSSPQPTLDTTRRSRIRSTVHDTFTHAGIRSIFEAPSHVQPSYVQLPGAIKCNIAHGLDGLLALGRHVAAVDARTHVLHDGGAGARVYEDAGVGG